MRVKNYFNSSIQTRLSHINSKNTHQQSETKVIPYLNTLQKCTQILREDRLWIRNQLKAGNEEIINIFKNYKKPFNLQHLQIKLRKHVTAVKSKQKMQQLMKFKQNMSLGQTEQHHFQNRSHMKSNKKNSTPKLPHERYRLPSSFSYNKFSKKMNLNNSLEKIIHQSKEKEKHSSYEKNYNNQNDRTYSYQNYNNKAKQIYEQKRFEKYEMPMERITERQSENVTSARHRAFQQETFGLKNQKNFNYPRWQKPETGERNNFLHEIKNMQEKRMNNPFQETLKNQISEHERIYEHDREEYEQMPSFPRYENTNQVKRDEDDGSQLQSFSAKRQGNQSFIEHEQIKNNENFHIPKQSQKIKLSYNFQKSKQSSPVPIQRYLQRHESQNNYHPPSFISSQKVSKDDGLFTSPQLLMECRMFINRSKSKSNTNEKSYIPQYEGSKLYNFESKLSDIKPLKFEEDKPFSFSQKNIDFKISSNGKCESKNEIYDPSQNQSYSQSYNPSVKNSYNPSYNNSYNASPDKVQSTNYYQKFYKETDYSFPVATEGKSYNITDLNLNTHSNPKIQSNFMMKKESQMDLIVEEENKNNFQYFQTFAALNNKKDAFSHIKEVNTQFIQNTIVQNSPEEIIEQVLEEIPSTIFPKYKVLMIFKQKFPFLEAQVAFEFRESINIQISELGNYLSKALKKEESQNEVIMLCSLLDIQKNGYIRQQDISNFLDQLFQAQAQNINEISQLLWSLYDKGVVLKQQQKIIDYWILFSMKQTQEFKYLQQILRQYEFEIDTNNDIQN